MSGIVIVGDSITSMPIQMALELAGEDCVVVGQTDCQVCVLPITETYIPQPEKPFSVEKKGRRRGQRRKDRGY